MNKADRAFPNNHRPWPWLRFVLGAGFVVLVWAVSFFLYANTTPSPTWSLGEAATVLFGAASVALFVFSILVGALAVVGWQAIERTIERAVAESSKLSMKAVEEATETVISTTAEKIGVLETDLRRKIDLLESELKNESKGRVLSGLGYMLGEMSTGPDTLKPQNKEKLEDAVDLCASGYELLQKVGGAAEFYGLNNLVFYSCVYGDNSNPDLMLAYARRMKEAGESHNAPNLLLTACRAILQYGSDPEEIQEARATLTYLIEAPGPDKQKKEAKLYLTSLGEQRENTSDQERTD